MSAATWSNPEPILSPMISQPMTTVSRVALSNNLSFRPFVIILDVLLAYQMPVQLSFKTT